MGPHVEPRCGLAAQPPACVLPLLPQRGLFEFCCVTRTLDGAAPAQVLSECPLSFRTQVCLAMSSLPG